MLLLRGTDILLYLMEKVVLGPSCAESLPCKIYLATLHQFLLLRLVLQKLFGNIMLALFQVTKSTKICSKMLLNLNLVKIFIHASYIY